MDVAGAPEPGPMSANPRWRMAAEDGIDWHEWGDEFVVRSARTAQTHLLSASAGNVLLALRDGAALNLGELFARGFSVAPAAGPDEPMSNEERDSILSILAELERLELVARASVP